MAEWTREEKIYNLLRYVLQMHINNRKGLASPEKLEETITYAIKVFVEEILGSETDDKTRSNK